jgi:hypothetical protein
MAGPTSAIRKAFCPFYTFRLGRRWTVEPVTEVKQDNELAVDYPMKLQRKPLDKFTQELFSL